MNSNNNHTSSQIDSEEESRRELEKIKADIIKILVIKDEPQSSQQLSYSTKYQKKYVEEGLELLIGEKRVKKKEIAKNNVVYWLI
jgi:23S rRNA pseudoU1915 N3-methylase RlmH